MTLSRARVRDALPWGTLDPKRHTADDRADGRLAPLPDRDDPPIVQAAEMISEQLA